MKMPTNGMMRKMQQANQLVKSKFQLSISQTEINFSQREMKILNPAHLFKPIVKSKRRMMSHLRKSGIENE